MGLLGDLRGARVLRVDAPARGLLTLTLSRPRERESLVFCHSARVRGVGLVDQRPRGAAADDFVRRLRKELEGAALDALESFGSDVTRLQVTRSGTKRWLVVEHSRSTPNVLLLDEHECLLFALDLVALRARGLDRGQPWRCLPSENETRAEPGLSELRTAGEKLLASFEHGGITEERLALGRAVRSARRKLDRRLAAIEQDIARAGIADGLRTEASLLIANLHLVAPGQTEVTVLDWTQPEPTERVIQIDPQLGAKAHAEKLFHTAKRLARGAPIAAQRQQEAAQMREALVALETRIEAATTHEALHALGDEAQRLGTPTIRRTAEQKTRREAAGESNRVPFRRFMSDAGHAILVGRSAKDNDALVLHHARPSDLWLHARSRSGAHVIVPLGRDEPYAADLLVDAATLAAHFSDARDEPVVDVQYALRRYVRKTKGSPPGAVTLDREKVLALRLETTRLARLLKSER